MNNRNHIFAIFCVLATSVAFIAVKDLYYASPYKEYYSHIILIPIVSAYFLYDSRKEIFPDSQYSFGPGILVMIVGALLFFAGRNMTHLNQNDLTSITVLSADVFLNGAFITMFGLRAFKAALFPLLFLVFAVPIPSAVMDAIITFLQVGSTEFTELLFVATGTSYIRDGFVFHLPGLSIEVAKQCSGIRSGLALFITSILAGHMFLRTRWKIVFLVLLTIPLTMFKNGIRIATLSILSIHVDPRIIQSSLHREGGIPFFIVALCLMAPVLFWLRRGDIKAGKIETRVADGKREGLLEPVMKFFRKG